MKQRTLLCFLLFVCSGAFQILLGQSLANYKAPNGSLVRTTGITYNSIEFTGNAVPSWRFTGSGAEDDDRSYPVNIGFDFWYLGTRYTTFSVSTNGFIDFSSATNNGGPATYQYGSTDNDMSQPATATTRTMPLTVAPFYYDQTTDTSGGGLDALGNGIRYLTTGTVGNRILTVEWIREQAWYSGSGGHPQWNYQVKLYEGTGVIEFVYGTMTIGSFSFAAQNIGTIQGYTSGLNGTSISAAPTAAQLLLQQTHNTATFSNSNATGGMTDVAHNLQTIPATNSSITFTPPVPSAATGISFTSVTQTSMQLNWTDVATNEIGYVLYRSDDGGATYIFRTQLAANTILYNQTGLLAGTTYYWKIHAVTEGTLSTALTGSQATTAAGNDTSAATGVWSSTATWRSGVVPSSAANVVIDNGHTVTIDQNVTVNTLSIGKGTSGILQIGNNATARTISVTGTIDVRSGGSFIVNTASNTSSHILNASGDIQNSGTFDMSSDADSRATTNLIKSGTQSISGSGSTTRFYLIAMNLGGSASNFLDVFATNFSSSTTNYLTVTSGIFNLATGVTTTPFTGNVTIPLIGGVRVNHSSAVVNTTGGNITVAGDVRVISGTLNIGNASNNNLISNGGVFVFSGGAINIAGRFEPLNSYALTNLTVSGGTITVNTTGSTSTTNAPFTMNIPGSVFTMSSGSIIVQRAGDPGGQNLGIINTSFTNYTITGGTFQIGNGSTPAASTISINSSIPIYNFTVNSTNVTSRLVTNNLVATNNVTITAGTHSANALNMTVGSNWLNSGTFTASTGKVTFNGTGSQSITNASGESFNKLTVNKSSGTLSLVNNTTVADSFALTAGTLDVSTLTLTLNGVVTSGGTLTCSSTSTVNYNKSTAVQNILAANYGNLTFSNFTKTLASSGTIGIAGTFTSGSATGHTITGSTINFNSSGSQNISSFQYNNLTISNAGTKTIQSGADSVLGTLTIGASNILADGGVSLNTFGTVVNSGTHSGAGALIFKGTSSQSLSGGGTFQNVTLNNASGVSMTGNSTIAGTLTFTSGVFSTGTDTLTVSGSVSRTSGHVNGWLKKSYTTGSNIMRLFEVGDATNYTPARLTFVTVNTGGNLTVKSTSGEHPNIITSYVDPTNNVNRYWSLIKSGGFDYTIASGYNASLLFVPGDRDQAGSETSYRINIYNGATWDSTTAATSTVDSTQATAIDSLGALVTGFQSTTNNYRTKASGRWTEWWNVWERFNGTAWVGATAFPKNADGLISILSGHTVTVDTNLSSATNQVDQVLINPSGQITVTTSGDIRLANGAGTDLTILGTFKITGTGTFSSASAAATVTIGDGGFYEHNINGGSITTTTNATTWSWNANSTLQITGITSTVPGSLNQTFGHFVWNCASQSAAISLLGNPTTVNGDFIVENTNTQQLLINDNTAASKTVGRKFKVLAGKVLLKSTGATAYAITVADSLVISGASSLRFASGGTSGAVTMTVSGHVSMSGDSLDLSLASVADSLRVAKNFVHASGVITETGAGSGNIIFNGTVQQIYTSGGTVSNTVHYRLYGASWLKLGSSSTLTGGGDFALVGFGKLEIGSTTGITSSGATGNIQVTGTRTYSSSGTYIYNGTSSQVTGIFTTSPTARTVYDLEINNSTGVSLSDSIAVTDSLRLVSGTLAVGTYTLYINSIATLTSGTLSSSATGTVNYNKSSAGQTILALNYGNLIFSGFNKTLPSSGTVGIAGNFTKNYATGHTVTGSTVNFNGTAQSIPKFTFNNLTVSGSGTKTADSTIIVNGTLTLSAGTLALSTSSVIVTAKGDVVNNAATSGSGKITLNGGSVVHALSGSGTYNNFEINDVFGATSSADITVNGTLTLTGGIFGMGSSTMIIGSSGSVTQTSGHVNGKIQKTIPVNASPQTVSFEVGDASAYAPVSLTFNAVSVGGTLTVSSTGVDHSVIKYSGLDQFKDVNRFWTLTNSGITFTTYDITMTFVAGDLDVGANTNAFFAKRYNATWFAATTSIRNSTWIKNLNVNGFGDFATGEVSTILYWTKGANTYNWGDDNNWSTNSQPTAFNDVTFDGKDTIEVNVAGTTNNLILQNDTLRLTILAGKTLTISGSLTQYGGIFSTRASFPTVTGITTLSGGTFGYDSSGGTQTVSAQTYFNLGMSGGGTKTAANLFTVNQNLTIGSGVTFADGGFTITVKDSITNNGTHTGAGKILFDGTVQHQLTGSGSLTNLQLNNSSNGVTLDSNVTINGTLTLSAGNITAASDTLYISSTGIISRTSGHIVGNLRKYFAPAGDSLIFEIGTASNYLPVTVSFGTISTGGNLTTQMLSVDHPDLTNSAVGVDSSINRYWILNNNGIAFDSYNITFNWVAGDVDAGISDFSDFIVAKKDNSVWDEIPSGVVTSTSIRGMNGTSFSAFAVGKPSSQQFISAATGNWNTAATWDLNKIPKRRDHVRIISPHVVTSVDTRKITNVEIQSGGEFADGGNILELYGNFIFSGRWSGSGRIEWYDGQDTLSGSGGKATGTSVLSIQATNRYITSTADTLYKIDIPSTYTVTNNGSLRLTRLTSSVAGGTWVNASGSTLSVSDTLFTTGTLTSTASNNTVRYDGTGAQSVKATNYHHLTLAGARTTNSITLPTSTINVAGTFTPSATFSSGNYVTTSNTIDFNGTGAQTIPAFSFNNLTVSGARTTNNVTLVNGDTIRVASAFTNSATFSSGNFVNIGNWFSFNGTGAQTIPAFNYNSLKIINPRTTNNITLASSDTIGIADSVIFSATFSSGNYITTGSKIAYNGTGRQTIAAFNYNDLSISGARTTNNIHFVNSGTIGIAGVFANSSSFSSGTFVITGSTVDFNGTTAQTIPALNYNNLTISGSRTTANVTLASSGTIGIASALTNSASFSSGAYIVTGSTISFNGSGAQSIPAFRFNNLQTATGGTKTAGGTIRIAKDFTIGASTTFDASSTTDTIYGNWTNNGTFTPSTSTIVLADTGTSVISGATTFATLVANKSSQAVAINLSSSISTGTLTMTTGTMNTSSNSVTITTTRSGNGIILGIITRTHTFSLSTAYPFEGPNSLITFTAGTPPSSVTMTVSQSAPASPTFVAVSRAVNIAMTGGSGLTSTLRLHYENSEANYLNETLMKLWQYSTLWLNRSSTAYDSVNNYIEVSGLSSSITGNWGIGSSASTKTVSDINAGTAIAGDSLLYTITILNPYVITKSSITISDPLSARLIIKSGTISDGGILSGTSNNGNGSLTGGTINWSAFSLTSGASTTRTFKVNTDSLMDVLEAVANTATIDFGGANIENVTTSINITNLANITIDTNVVSNQTPIPGDTLVFTLKYRNAGTSNATTIALTYTIPGNTSFVTNAYAAGSGIEVNGVSKTNAIDGDEVNVSGSNILVNFTSLTPGSYKLVKFKTIVN